MDKTYRIKPLEWEEDKYTTIALSIVGNAVIEQDTPKFYWSMCEARGVSDSIEEAKKECEQIYLSRMREGLKVVE